MKKKVIDELICNISLENGQVNSFQQFSPDTNVRTTIRRNIEYIRFIYETNPSIRNLNSFHDYLRIFKLINSLKQSIKWLWYIRNHKINSIKHLNHSHKPNRRKASNE